MFHRGNRFFSKSVFALFIFVVVIVVKADTLTYRVIGKAEPFEKATLEVIFTLSNVKDLKDFLKSKCEVTFSTPVDVSNKHYSGVDVVVENGKEIARRRCFVGFEIQTPDTCEVYIEWFGYSTKAVLFTGLKEPEPVKIVLFEDPINKLLKFSFVILLLLAVWLLFRYLARPKIVEARDLLNQAKELYYSNPQDKELIKLLKEAVKLKLTELGHSSAWSFTYRDVKKFLPEFSRTWLEMDRVYFTNEKLTKESAQRFLKEVENLLERLNREK